MKTEIYFYKGSGKEKQPEKRKKKDKHTHRGQKANVTECKRLVQ